MSEIRYGPWGTTRYTSGTTPTNFHYTGQREETGIGGLYFYGARWYDNVVQRFLSADTIVPGTGNPQALNRYSYSLNGPTKYTDPSGHRPTDGCETEGCNIGLMDPTPPDVSLANDIAFSADQLAEGASAIEAGVTDFMGVGLIATGCAVGPEGCGAGVLAAGKLDLTIASTSPLGVAENILGLVSLGATAYSDIRLGNTNLINNTTGPRVGIDTLVSARNALVGIIPESNLDLAVSSSQVNYDLARQNGTKPGGAIPVSNLLQLAVQVAFKDWL